MAKSLLTQRIPDGMLMRVHMSNCARMQLCSSIPKRANFLELRCPERGNTWEFFMDLRVKEELARVGDIDDKDYLSTIISSLPLSLSCFAAAQLAAARMFLASKSIDPDVLIFC